jgi:ribosome-binding ATPase YchF (GTP1/OBG family)
MKNNELSTMEKLDVALQSHKFYNERCVDLEKKINIKIDSIFQTEEAGKNISKEDIQETVSLVNQLLSLSSKYMMEGSNVVSELEKATKGEIEKDFAKTMKKQLTALNIKQEAIHDRVTEIQEMLIDLYNEDDDTF